MDPEQIKKIEKKFKLVHYYKNGKFDNKIFENLDKNNKYYNYYTDLYGKEFDSYRKNPDNFMKINYEPFNLFYEILKDECIDEKYEEYVNLYNKGTQKDKFSLDYLEYNKETSFYKAMDGFYTLEDDIAYSKNNRYIPTWFSAPYLAFVNQYARYGGINAYKVKGTTNVLIVNCKNMTEIIKFVRENLRDTIEFRGTKHNKKYIIELLKLAACSEDGLLDQMEIFSKFNKYGDELWLATESVYGGNNHMCKKIIDNNDYFGIVKSKGKHNYNFAYLLNYLNTTYWKNFFHAYIIVQKYSPYQMSSSASEEFVFFDQYSSLSRNIKDQYDWYNYKNKLDFNIPSNFRLPFMFSEYNTNFYLYKYYDNDFKKDNVDLLEQMNKNISLIFFDANNYKSINENDSRQDNKNDMSDMIDYFNPDACVLMNATDYSNNKYNMEIEGNITFMYKEPLLKKKLKIAYYNMKPKIGYPYGRPYFNKFVNIANINYDHHKKFINDMNFDSNIIILRSDLTYNSPELKIIESKGYYTNEYKLSIYNTNKYMVFSKIKPIYHNTIKYNKSYFMPVVLIFDKSL